MASNLPVMGGGSWVVTARPSSVFSSRWAECISSSGSGRAGVSQALARPWRGRSGVITLLLVRKVSRAINNRCFLAGPAGKGEAQSSAQRANCFGYLPHLTWIRTWVTDVISGTNVMSTVIDFLYSVVLCTKQHNIRLEVRLCQAGRERERSCSVSSGCECYVWLPLAHIVAKPCLQGPERQSSVGKLPTCPSHPATPISTAWNNAATGSCCGLLRRWI